MLSEISDASQLLMSELLPLLCADDDTALWATSIPLILEEFHLHLDEPGSCYIEVGVCSHWLRPHQTRWTAAGGFAWPSGYGGSGHSRFGLPEFDWSMLFLWESGKLTKVEQYSDKRRRVMRVTFPARTARHQQAVLHILWYPSKECMFFGLRKVRGEWKMVATRDLNEGRKGESQSSSG